MKYENEFRDWLKQRTQYTDAVIGDIVSRVKRAGCILPIYEDEVYQFYLERTDKYKSLSASVRSQLKKSLSLFYAFLHETKNHHKNNYFKKVLSDA